MVRGGRKPTDRGAPYESTSITAVYGTYYSLVWESWGSPNFGSKLILSPENFGKKELSGLLNSCFPMGQSGKRNDV